MIKIFFSAPDIRNPELHERYSNVVKFLEECNVEVVSLFHNEHTLLLSSKIIDEIKERNLNDQEYLKKELDFYFSQYAIQKCDGVVVESSEDSFQIGYETRSALDLDKPTLSMSNGRRYLTDTRAKFLYTCKYKDYEEMKSYITEFIKFIEKRKKNIHMHLLFTWRESNYLEWAATKYSKSKSEIIRSLIHEKIGKEIEYREDLEGYMEK